MKNRYEEESGSQFDEASDIAIRLKVLAGEIYNAQTNLEWLKRQMFVTTASGEYLDYIAEQRGLERKKAKKAKGSLKFSIAEPVSHDVYIPTGATVATEHEAPIRFCTTEPGVIENGDTYVYVNAEAEQVGYNGNIARNLAVVPVSIPAEIDEVTNPHFFTGGDDIEGDSALRERIKKTFINQPNGMNAAYYEQLALTVDGVDKVGVVGKARGSGTVNVYVSGKDGEVGNDVLEKVQLLLDEKRELNVSVLVLNATYVNYDLDVTVTAKAGYENEEIIEKCTNAFVDYIGSIPVGGRLYLSSLGKYLLDTDCIENYEFDVFMQNKSISGSQYFKVGNVNIEVK